MKNFEKYFVIKTMSELLAYEIYFYYKKDKSTINEIEMVYETVFTEIPHHKYKNEIMELGILLAKILYDVPIQ